MVNWRNFPSRGGSLTEPPLGTPCRFGSILKSAYELFYDLNIPHWSKVSRSKSRKFVKTENFFWFSQKFSVSVTKIYHDGDFKKTWCGYQKFKIQKFFTKILKAKPTFPDDQDQKYYPHLLLILIIYCHDPFCSPVSCNEKIP